MSEESNSELAKGIGVAAEKALEFIEKVIAGPIMEGTGMFTDKVKYWRFKNQVNTIIKAREFLKEKGIETPQKVPIKDVTSLLEYASFEENEIMKDSWAKLLANAMDPNNQFTACHIFSQILNQLSVNEIYVLNHMLSNSFILSSGDRPYFEGSELLRNSHSTEGIRFLILDNLLRLRLIEEKPGSINEKTKTSNLFIDDENVIENEIVSSNRFRLSKFGSEFIVNVVR